MRRLSGILAISGLLLIAGLALTKGPQLFLGFVSAPRSGVGRLPTADEVRVTQARWTIRKLEK